MKTLSALFLIVIGGLIVISSINGCSNLKDGKVKYQTVEIEGCEYIFLENSAPEGNNYSFSIAHKGNCKNPIHRAQ